VRTFLPGLVLLRAYERPWLRGDVVAGITVAAYLVPQVMAYAEVAGLPPVVGLWAIMAPLLVYAVLGSSRQLSVGPESTTALMTATAIGALGLDDPDAYAALAAALAVVVGVVCLIGRVVRLGVVGDLLSKPVLVGYMAGIAGLMISSQLDQLTGVSYESDSFLEEVTGILTRLDEIHLPTAVLAATTFVFLQVGSHFWPKAPIPLLGMVLAAAAVALFDLESRGIEVIGHIPSDLPRPAVPDVSLSDLASIALPAVAVAMVGYTDNIVTARTFASRNDYEVDNNQELLALGAANLAAGFTQGFPVSSSGSRTVIGDALGSRTQLYSVVAAGVVLCTLIFLRPLLASFPMAALGAIVVYAALRLVDLGEFRRLGRFRRSEMLLALATTVAVLLVDVLYGIVVAVGLSLLDLLRRVARPHDGILGYVPGLAGMHDIDDYPDAALVPGLIVYRYDSPLFFANVEDFKSRALASLDESDGTVEWFVLNAEANTQLDITAVDALDQLRESLLERGIVFAVARVKQDLRDDLVAGGFVARMGEENIFMTLPTAVDAYIRWYTDRHGRPPAGFTHPPNR
jgi:high affinity sulfate transporter 1